VTLQAVTVDAAQPEADDLAAVLDYVLRADTRSFRCECCGVVGELLVTQGPTGRTPTKCERCEPLGRPWTREREVRPLMALIRAQHVELQRRQTDPWVRVHPLVSVLVAQQAEIARLRVGPKANGRRAFVYGEPGPTALASAVSAVALSRRHGREALREAVLDLVAVGAAYARRLERSDG
jgi:hypothetical protein